MTTTVVFHSADFDGIFCREIARKFLPDAKLIGWDFADAPLEIPTGQVYVLDLPVDRVFGFKYEATDVDKPAPQHPAGLVWIDHHKSAIETHPKAIPGYRIDGVAACRLAWQWFSGFVNTFGNDIPQKEDYIERRVNEPLAVRLAGEYDIWDKRDPRADIFQYGLRSRELTTEDWTWILGTTDKVLIADDIIHQLLVNGELLQTYQQRNDAGIMHRSFVIEWEGLKFLALTTARCNSLTFASKDVLETGHDALMGFYYDGKGWTVSLYHAAHRTDLDLSKIAVKYGGGGHRGACGFRTTKPPFLP